MAGLAIETPFLKDGLDRLGIRVEGGKRYEYKSAPDTFTDTAYPPPARENLQQLLDSLFGQFVADVYVGGDADISADATAYSVAQQLVGTAWNIVYALILMIWAWGWGGGKQFVTDSYGEAKRRQAEEQEKRRARKAARSAESEQAAP